jgi:hypothetical protein
MGRDGIRDGMGLSFSHPEASGRDAGRDELVTGGDVGSSRRRHVPIVNKSNFLSDFGEKLTKKIKIVHKS